MAGNGLNILFRRKRPDTVPCNRSTQPRLPVPRRHGIRDDKERRWSLSDPTKRKNISMSPSGAGGLLGTLGSLLSLSPKTPRVYYSGKSFNYLPQKKLVPFHPEIVASYSGPYGGLANSALILPSTPDPGKDPELSSDDDEDLGRSADDSYINGNRNEKRPSADLDASKWRLRNEKAYGMSLSLYEYKNRGKTECTGDPIADVFAIRATCTSCIMAVADGVGWGQGARRAAQCAVKGAMEHMWTTLYYEDSQIEPFTTTDVFQCMTEALDQAQELIISREGSLTTLCLAVVADIMSDDTTTKALCVINVGDSLAFVYSHQHGVKEVTVGCREYNLHRNIRFCDGALGPCFGENPDLGNLTFAFTTVEEGDIVFLTTDGVSDNFDPVIARRAVASSDFKSRKSRAEMIFSDQSDVATGDDVGRMPALTPRERQEAMTRMMEIVIRQTEIPSENEFSASNLCSKLLQYAVNLTDKKRAAHEATNNIISICEKESLESAAMLTGKEALSRHARGLPGKLDHATVVAYVVGGSAPDDGAPVVAYVVGSSDPDDGAQSTSKQGDGSRQEPPSDFDVTVGNKQNTE